MVKFISKIIGSKIILFQERVIVGAVDRVLIDPDDGAMVGLVVTQGGTIRYVPTGEIKGFGQGIVIIEDLNSLSEEEDVIKIGEVLSKEPKIIGSRVRTESGERLGRVNEATVDLRSATLKKIYVTPKYLGLLGEDKIIDAKQIVRIEKEKIIVKDNFAKQGRRIGLPAQMPISE